MEMVGKRLGLQVIWSDEVGYESLFEGLRSNRYDIFAGGLWPNANRAKQAISVFPYSIALLKHTGGLMKPAFVIA